MDAHAPKGTTGSTRPSRVGPLRGIKRGLGWFAAGFRGTTWDRTAAESVKEGLDVLGGLPSQSDAGKQSLDQRIEDLLRTRRPFLRSEAAVKAIGNRVTLALCACAVAVPAVVAGLITPRGVGGVGTYFAELLGVAL